MQLAIETKRLAAAVSAVGQAVPRKHPNDIYKLAHLIVADNTAVLVGTDSEYGIRYTLDEGIVVDNEGESLLDLRIIEQIVRESHSDTIRMALDYGLLRVKDGGSEYRIQTPDPKEYPTVRAFDSSTPHVTLPGKVLRRLLDLTTFAVDSHSTRYAISGVLFDLTGDNLALVATDSRRLSYASSPCTKCGDPEDRRKPVVPGNTLNSLRSILGESDGDVCVALNANDALFQADCVSIYARLVEGRFPAYRDVIPTGDCERVEMVVGPLLTACRQAQIATDKESVSVDFTFADGTLSLGGRSASASAAINLPISYQGSETAVSFDVQFWIDVLKQYDASDQVNVELRGADSAAVLQMPHNTYLVMPMAREVK